VKQKEKPYELRRWRIERARRKGTHTHEEWLALIATCGNRCVKCFLRFSDDNPYTRVQKDHILPIYLGGSDSIDNLQPLCMRCNVSKGPDSTDYRSSMIVNILLGIRPETPLFEYGNV
jgi:5-methylcytosine-specific restriction endonuclease McrA